MAFTENGKRKEELSERCAPLLASILPSSSTAGTGTSITVSLNKNPVGGHGASSLPQSPLNVTFDIGGTVSSATTAVPSSLVFISHSHADHIMGVFSHARHRSTLMRDAAPCKYFIPAGFYEK